MQFYLIVPFIVVVAQSVGTFKVLLCLLALSKGYEIHNSRKHETFGFLEGRLWQFVVGIGVYAVQQSASKKKLVLSQPEGDATEPLIKHDTHLPCIHTQVN